MDQLHYQARTVKTKESMEKSEMILKKFMYFNYTNFNL